MQNNKTLEIIMLSLVALGVFFLPLLETVSYWGALTVGIALIVLIMSFRRKPELIVIILFCLLIHAQWGVAEFIIQDDLNLRLLGETQLSIEKIGIAKFGDDKTLRAYGPYRHANSFGGIMVIALILWLISCSRIVTLRFLNLFSLVIVLALLFAFSRSALISLLLLSLIMSFRRDIGSRRFVFVGFVIILLIIFTPYYIDRFSDPRDMAVSERLSGYNWSFQIIKENSLWKGVGSGMYKSVLQKNLVEAGIKHSAWQIDFVHSVPLLVVAVIGLFPAITLSVILTGLIYKYISRPKFVLMLSMLPLLLLDHYLITQVAPFTFLLLLIFI